MSVTTTEYMRTYRQRPGKRVRHRAIQLHHKTPQTSVSEFEEYLLKHEDDPCHLCGLEAGTFSRRHHLDHCHETGRIRGILCHKCNVAIGALGDNIAGVERAARYLKE